MQLVEPMLCLNHVPHRGVRRTAPVSIVVVAAVTFLFSGKVQADASADAMLASVRQSVIENKNYKDVARSLVESNPSVKVEDFLAVRAGDEPMLRAANALFLEHPGSEKSKGDALAGALKNTNDPVAVGLLLLFAPHRFASNSGQLRMVLTGLLDDHRMVGDGYPIGASEASVAAFNALSHVLKVNGLIPDSDEWALPMAPGTFENVRSERVQRLKKIIVQQPQWFNDAWPSSGLSNQPPSVGAAPVISGVSSQKKPQGPSPKLVNDMQPSFTARSVTIALVIVGLGLGWLLVKRTKKTPGI